MALEQIPLKKGRPLDTTVSVSIDGGLFTGWEAVSVEKSLESISDSFSINLFENFTGVQSSWPIKPGVRVEISIGRERVVTGRIDRLSVNYSNENRGFVISGRSLAGDLVDCSHVGAAEFQNIKIAELARKLVEPFGLKVFESVASEEISKFAVKPGESVFEALDRAARMQGFFFISTREGNIRLTRAARARAHSSLEQDVNILTARSEFDFSDRYSKYIVKGQTSGTDEFFGLDSAQPQAEASDAAISRHRPLIVLAESSVDSARAKQRAQWEASSRLAKSIRVNAVVPGWRQGNGELWGKNQVIKFKSKFLGIDRDLLSVQVSHEEDSETGQITSLTLVDPQSYNMLPEVNKGADDDIASLLGSGF